MWVCGCGGGGATITPYENDDKYRNKESINIHAGN